MNATIISVDSDDDWNYFPEFNSYLIIIGVALLILLIIFPLVKYWKVIKIVVLTLPRDAKFICRLIKTVKDLKFHQKHDHSVSDIFDAVVQSNSSKVCFCFEGQEWTFREVSDFSNKVANYFLNQGYRKGDVVALFMENRPEYACIWLGLSKIGIIPSLINSNLRLQPLKHSFDIVPVKGIIYGQELSQAVVKVYENSLDKGTSIVFYSVCSFKSAFTDLPVKLTLLEEKSKSLKKEIQAFSASHPLIIDKPKFDDSLFYMYTSGTTGLPKAAIVKHARYITGSIGVHHLNGLRSDDVIYTCLPLYHTAAGIAALGQALFYGNTIILRKKFSASQFWKDCFTHQVTVAQYIGETCRYLLSREPSPEEKQHCIRLMFGNGLRPEIWKTFVDRFNIPNISEAYGSTDGNCNMINFDNRVGAVGFVPIWAYRRAPTFLIKLDNVTGEPKRDPKTGLVMQCGPNEIGELVGKIVENNPVREFKGYAGNDGSINDGKVLRDVRTKGDAVFRTGDHLIMDDFGYFFFKDRAGDTFRWKGENVSTAEVESIISSCCSLQDCVVYGVEIPFTDGKAGMAAISTKTDDLSLNLITLADEVIKSLPPYARPLFLRITKSIDMTGTYKMKKLELQSQGYDISQIEDPLFYFTGEKYVPLDSGLFSSIMGGRMRNLSSPCKQYWTTLDAMDISSPD